MATTNGARPNERSLPDGWEWCEFGAITKNFDSRRVPIKASERGNITGQYPYYGASGIIDHVKQYLFEGDYLLIAEDGANLLSRSTPIAFQAHKRFWVNNHAHVVRTLNGIPLAFLEHYLNSIDLKFYITGTAQPKLTQANLNRIPVPVPPLTEQERIVSRIEELFSDLDAGVAALERVRLGLKRYRAAALQAACSGKLLANNAAIGTDGLPEGWRLVAVWDLAKKEKHAIKRGPFGSSVKKAYFVPKGYKVYEQQNVIENDFTLGSYYIDVQRFEELKAFAVAPGDLLITGAGTIGKVAVVPSGIEPGIINQALLKLSLDPETVNQEFFILWFETRLREYLVAQSRGSAMKNISSVKDLKNMELGLPPLNEQKEIMLEVERRLSVVRHVEQAVNAGQARAARLRQAVLKAAFEGRL